jgi:HD-GYP domain-containing protein (c-di-GMP phosphodiesterase class II)
MRGMRKEPLRKFDSVEKVKLRVGDLRVGMFVCDLDRPWLETPFLFQGFELMSEADIAEVRRYCEYVYIDLLRTHLVEIQLDAAPPPHSYINERRPHSFEKEVLGAEATRQQTADLIRSFVEDVHLGASLDVHLARAAVSECVASILRNPDVMLLLARMRDQDELICQHGFNACIYSIMLGHAAGLRNEELVDLGTCGLLHDIGKVSVPLDILNKRSRLNSEEFSVVKRHTSLGRDILLSGRNTFSDTVEVAYGHHENIDGTGYPLGLLGCQITQNCKIVAVAEKYDAITSVRPFRPAYNHLDAIRILNAMAGKSHLDAPLTTAFVACLGIYPPGSAVELSNGEVAIVLQSNPLQRLRPQIMVIRDAYGASLGRQGGRLVDMALKEIDETGLPYKIKAVRRPEDLGIDPESYRAAIFQCLG